MTSAREMGAGLGELRQTYERTLNGWISPGLNGWRFTDNQGRVFRLDEEEGEQLHRAAREKVDELFDSLEGQVWYMAIAAAIVGFFAIKLTDEYALYGTMPSAVYFVPFLAFLFKDVANEARFAWEMNKWRSAIAAQLRAREGGDAASERYSLLKDDRLMVWIGWALFAPGMIGFFLAYDNADLFFLFIGMMIGGVFALRTAYNLD